MDLRSVALHPSALAMVPQALPCWPHPGAHEERGRTCGVASLQWAPGRPAVGTGDGGLSCICEDGREAPHSIDIPPVSPESGSAIP